jgi:uncharacterized protein (TIGR02284 family)
MESDTATLNELIDVLEDGKRFYLEASTEVARPDLRALFAHMATVKAAIASDLRTAVVAVGDAPSSGSLAGCLRQAYAEIKARLSSDQDHTYIAELEQFEDRILRAFRQAAHESKDQAVRTLAERYLPDVVRDHTHMRELQRSRAA